jgi:chromosome segregation ATPase
MLIRMSRLELAQERLAAALEALEKAGKAAAERLKAATEIQGRFGALDGERERLLAKIADLEEELAALSSVTLEVEGRLDGAIGEIRAALARQ